MLQLNPFPKDATVLIMAKATLALDTETDRQAQEALDNLRTGRTMMIIAHCLSTVAANAPIVVLRMRAHCRDRPTPGSRSHEPSLSSAVLCAVLQNHRCSHELKYRTLSR